MIEVYGDNIFPYSLKKKITGEEYENFHKLVWATE
jgi:hypothetical protein